MASRRVKRTIEVRYIAVRDKDHKLDEAYHVVDSLWDDPNDQSFVLVVVFV